LQVANALEFGLKPSQSDELNVPERLSPAPKVSSTDPSTSLSPKRVMVIVPEVAGTVELLIHEESRYSTNACADRDEAGTLPEKMT